MFLLDPNYTGINCQWILLNSNLNFLLFWRRQWHPTPVLLPGKSHGRRSLEGCSPWGRWGSDTTERLHFHFSLSCIGERNGNPLQCFCLENPRDGGDWWVAVYGVAQSQTRLKRLSSSSILNISNCSPLVLSFTNLDFSLSSPPPQLSSSFLSFFLIWGLQIYKLILYGCAKRKHSQDPYAESVMPFIYTFLFFFF